MKSKGAESPEERWNTKEPSRTDTRDIPRGVNSNGCSHFDGFSGSPTAYELFNSQRDRNFYWPSTFFFSYFYESLIHVALFGQTIVVYLLFCPKTFFKSTVVTFKAVIVFKFCLFGSLIREIKLNKVFYIDLFEFNNSKIFPELQNFVIRFYVVNKVYSKINPSCRIRN